MHLRELRIQDAPLMLEWMHDDSVVHDLKTDFASKTLKDCERFIEDSLLDTHNLHLAVADESDNYLGTVSLKNICNNAAEFAITIRPSAMGLGIAAEAMRMIIEIGFENDLNYIYWCVSPDNKRAVRFYDKNRYCRVSPDALNIVLRGYSEEQIQEYYWYLIAREKKGQDN